MEEERVKIEGKGFVLNGRLRRMGKVWGLVCHPHPAYGGNMDNNVVMACCEGFWQRNISTLRFNFRDTDNIDGMAPEDVKTALQFLKREESCSLRELILAGYSFGAWAALRAAESEKLDLLGWIAIAPPLALWDLTFAGKVRGRALVLAGTRDGFCPKEKMEEFFDKLKEPKQLIYLEGADHFFWGWEAKLRDVIGNELARFLEGDY